MTRVQAKTVDPWADLRDRDNVFVSSSPRTTATISMPPSQGIRSGWWLFTRSLWRTVRRRTSITFSIEGDS